jgi:subtilisin-like proprotein convertase family protein
MLFRFPDLYDSDYTSNGLGDFCLMAGGSYGRDGSGKQPINPNAWLRSACNWYDTLIELNGFNGPMDIEHNYSKIYKYSTQKPNEFFIIEARLNRAHDAGLPGEGLAIYHIDTNQTTNENEAQTATGHYLISLIQADGRQDLEKGDRGNSGDTGDLYVAGGAINDTTIPSSKLWDKTPSGLAVKILNVDRSAGIIKVHIGKVEEGPVKKIVESSPVQNEIIPDGFREGIRNSIEIKEGGICVSVKVSVSITHSWAADLNIILKSPSGKQFTIATPNPSAGKSSFKQIIDFDVTSTFRDTDIKGFWTLNVADFFDQDVGTLNNWQLTLEYK